MKKPLLTTLAACAVLTACSPGTPSSAPRFTGPQTTGSGPTADPIKALDLSTAQAAAPVASDTTVTLAPKLYADPGNPCASVTTNVFLNQVPPDCANAYVMTNGSTVIAGSQIITQSPQSRTTKVQAGISAAQAQQIGNAFFVSEALRAWAVQLNVGIVIPTIDGLGAASDPLYLAIKSKPLADAAFPPCVYPASTRVITADQDARTYIESQGWAGPSSTAVVATYKACDGATLRFTDGTTKQILGHAHPVSVVITGHVAKVAPFGPIWVEDGWAPCGAPALKNACA